MAGGCQQNSWKLKLTLLTPITPPFANSKQVPPFLGDQACTHPGEIRRGSPRASALLSPFWENSPSSGHFWLSVELPLHHASVVSVHHLALPIEVPGLLQITAYSKSIPVPTGQGREDEPGRKGLVLGPGTQNGNRKGG